MRPETTKAPLKNTTDKPASLRSRGRRFALATLGVLAISGVAYVPAAIYRDYYQAVDLREAVSHGRLLAAAVGPHLAKGSIPVDAVTGAVPRNPYVDQVLLDERSGQIRLSVSLHFIGDATIVLTPSLDNSGAISWQCTSPNVALEKLPPTCQSW